MDAWEYVDRGGDLASIYGVRQRQTIIDSQRRAHALLETQLDLERARLESDEIRRAEEKVKLDNLKKARKTLCVIDGLVSALEAHSNVTARDVTNLAVAQKQLDFFSSKETFETLEDIRAVLSLQNKANQIEQKWRSTGQVKDSPLILLLAALPQLDACLGEADKLFASRLVIHPTLETHVAKTVSAFRQEADKITHTLNYWEEEHRKGMAELERMGLHTKEGEEKFARDAGMFDLGKVERWEEIIVRVNGAADAYSKAISEWHQLEEKAGKLLEELRLGHLVSQLDERRKALMVGLDEKRVDVANIKKAETRVSTLHLSLDDDLDRLARAIPVICLDEQNRSVNPAICALAEVLDAPETNQRLDNLKKAHLYSFVFRHGILYEDLKKELQDVLSWLAAARDDYEKQCALLKDLQAELEGGNVFKAEKRLKGQSFKFTFVGLDLEAPIIAARSQYAEAVRIAKELQALRAKKSHFIGKFLVSQSKHRDLEQKAQSLLAQAETLGGEIRDAILALFN